MSIGTFAELKTAAANWLDRSDLTDRIPEFIVLAEARFNRVLRIRDMETVSTAISTTGGTREYSLVPPTVEIAVETVSISLILRIRLNRASARAINSGIRSVRSLLSNQFAAAVFNSAKVPIAMTKREQVSWLYQNHLLSGDADIV